MEEMVSECSKLPFGKCPDKPVNGVWKLRAIDLGSPPAI